MDEIYHRIKIIPTEPCLTHEGIIQQWVDQIASNIKNDRVMKNPIIVTRHKNYYVVLDGMHRFAAIEQLGIKDILAYEVDYFSDSILLGSSFTKQEIIDAALSKKILPPKSTCHLIPGRPLRVDVDLSLLSSDSDLEEKNRVLQNHLRWCYQNNRVRFYPESVHIFSD